MSALRMAALAAAVTVAAGCDHGDPEDFGTVVRGTVTLDGKPLDRGSVIFSTPAYGAKVAPLGPDGTYKLANLPPGQVPVAVTQVVIGEKAARGGPKGTVPKRYGTAETSGLKATVGKGETVYDIPLKSKG